MMTLRVALERAGIALPADEPVLDVAEPNRGSLEWVVRPHAEPVGRINGDYNPFSPDRRG